MKIKKTIFKILAAVVISLLLQVEAFPYEYNSEEVYKAAEELVNALGGAEYIYSLEAGESVNDWLVIGMSSFDIVEGREHYIAKLEKYIQNMYSGDLNNIQATVWHRLVLASIACDKGYIYSDHDLIADGVYNHATYGELGKQGINGYIWGLIALDTAGVKVPDGADYSREDIVSEIVSLQHEDGSFSLMGPGDVDVTAMALQALANYADDSEIDSVINKAINWLSVAQLPDGSFESYGTSNAESTAQVIIMLAALDIDVQSDERFVKNGYSTLDALMSFRTESGSFAHVEGGKTNGLASAQCLLALAAVYNSFEVEEVLEIETEEGTTSGEVKEEIATETVIEEEITTEAVAMEDATTEAVAEKKESTNNSTRLITVVLLILAIVAILLFIFVRKIRKIVGFIIIVLLVTAGLINLKIQTPDEFYQSSSATGDSEVFVDILCNTALSHYDELPEGLKAEKLLPEDGIMYSGKVSIDEGMSALDILLSVAADNKLQLDYTGMKESAYIKGIGYLYEFDAGPLSGWMYSVSGEFPGVSCGEFFPKAGDRIVFEYTCDLGRDIGNIYVEN